MARRARSVISDCLVQFGFPTSGTKLFYFKDMTGARLDSIPELIGITLTHSMIRAEVVHMLKQHY